MFAVVAISRELSVESAFLVAFQHAPHRHRAAEAAARAGFAALVFAVLRRPMRYLVLSYVNTPRRFAAINQVNLMLLGSWTSGRRRCIVHSRVPLVARQQDGDRVELGFLSTFGLANHTASGFLEH